jgi:hypothetical protein
LSPEPILPFSLKFYLFGFNIKRTLLMNS